MQPYEQVLYHYATVAVRYIDGWNLSNSNKMLMQSIENQKGTQPHWRFFLEKCHWNNKEGKMDQLINVVTTIDANMLNI